ncbi:hypothetical protein IVA93_02885 [Bradyrhizobium sp. 155]|uniref:hypothetical protein n=1 Tax=Bradyrhizobium sp. 155 TaxID=2782629 RepID=UPI00200009D5|nr:hypothetical protein [Bradyrhizobium sp. 155]UPK12186.1 hypothetical protein IVA93_02885 [Bradyrhizobium sp. 155]
MTDSEETVARLAVEYWKLLRVLERALDSVPEDRRERYASQGRYAADRLDELLRDRKMSVQSFDGMDFEINLPASPVNGDEFPGRADVVVARTIEPAVIADMRPVLMGKVYLASKE